MKKLITALVLFLVCLGFSGCSSERVFTLAYLEDCPPYVISGNDGVGGQEVELIRAIAEAEKIKVEFKKMRQEDLDEAIAAKAIDGILTMTTKETADFKPTDSFADMVVGIGSAKGIEKADGIDGIANRRIGIYKYSEMMDTVLSYREKYGYSIKAYETVKEMAEGIRNGDVEYIFDDVRLIAYLNEMGAEMTLGYTKSLPDQYAIGILKNNDRFETIFNRGLIRLINDGTYKRIMDRYSWKDRDVSPTGKKETATDGKEPESEK